MGVRCREIEGGPRYDADCVRLAMSGFWPDDTPYNIILERIFLKWIDEDIEIYRMSTNQLHNFVLFDLKQIVINF